MLTGGNESVRKGLRLIPAPRSADAPIRWRTELLTVRFADKLFARLR